MVSTISIVFMIISLIISIFFPVALAIYFYRKHKISFKSVAVGALVFFVFQIITRIPLLTFLGRTEWYVNNIASNIFILGLFLSLSAGVFEEVGRFLGFKLLLKDKRDWQDGIAYGIGHGGIESILLIGLSMVNNIVTSFLINSGNLESLIKLQGQSPQYYETVKNTFLSTPSYMFLISGFERVFAITAHILFSLVVLYGIRKRKNIYLLYAILLHTAMNLPAVLIKNPLLSEAYLLGFFTVALVLIIRFKEKFHTID